MKKLLLMFVAFVFAATGVFATTTGPASGSAAVKIIAPLVLNHDTNATLNFGTWVQPSSQGTVTIPANSNPTPSASDVERIAADPVSSDHFTVVNTDNVTYSVNLPSNFTVSDGGSETMTVSSITASCTSNCTATEFYVGGTLTIPANQATGTYTGNYNVTLTY